MNSQDRKVLRGPEARTAAPSRDEAFWRDFSALIKGYVQRQVDPLRAELAELRKELVSREYRGTWRSDTPYARHNSVTHGGSLWIARADTKQKPGDGDAWQLAVKHGRDART